MFFMQFFLKTLNIFGQIWDLDGELINTFLSIFQSECHCNVTSHRYIIPPPHVYFLN